MVKNGGESEDGWKGRVMVGCFRVRISLTVLWLLRVRVEVSLVFGVGRLLLLVVM